MIHSFTPQSPLLQVIRIEFNGYSLSLRRNRSTRRRQCRTFLEDKMAPLQSTKFEVIKSCEDKRDYRGYVLPNQMRVLLVSDPSTEKSAAAVDVHVGKYRERKY